MEITTIVVVALAVLVGLSLGLLGGGGSILVVPLLTYIGGLDAKTTLLDLVPRLHDVTGGRVLVGGPGGTRLMADGSELAAWPELAAPTLIAGPSPYLIIQRAAKELAP